MTSERWVTFNRSAAVVPWILLVVVAVFCLWQGNYWPLLAAPGIFLGWIGAAPNFNLADGCLCWITLLLSWLVAIWLPPVFFVGIGAIAAWIASSIELAIRAKSIPQDLNDVGGKPPG